VAYEKCLSRGGSDFGAACNLCKGGDGGFTNKWLLFGKNYDMKILIEKEYFFTIAKEL